MTESDNRQRAVLQPLSPSISSVIHLDIAVVDTLQTTETVILLCTVASWLGSPSVDDMGAVSSQTLSLVEATATPTDSAPHVLQCDLAAIHRHTAGRQSSADLFESLLGGWDRLILCDLQHELDDLVIFVDGEWNSVCLV